MSDTEPSTDQFADVVEITTLPMLARAAINRHLEAGYRILSIGTECHWEAKPGKTEESDGYVRRRVFCVLGRPAGVPALEQV